jgi:DNA-binding CsgD family transcriptional regulator
MRRFKRTPGSTFALVPLVSIAVARGDHALAWSLIHDWLPGGPTEEPGDTWFSEALLLQHLAAELLIGARDFVGARTWLEAHDRWLNWNGAVWGRAEGRLAWSALAFAEANPTRAEDDARTALADASLPRQPVAIVSARRMLGQIAMGQQHHEDALNELTIALELATTCGLVYEQALTRLTLAELLMATDRGSAATSHLVQARAVLSNLKARPALERARLLTHQLHRRGHGRSLDPLPGLLTAREIDILQRLANGQPGHEIAAALGISVRTVERHITNIYAKIGARNRAEATAFAHRANVV